MSIRTQVRNSWIGQLTEQMGLRLVLLSLLFVVAAGCAPAGTQPADLPTPQSIASPTTPVEQTLPSVPSGWETYTNQGQCSHAISYPSDMDGNPQDANSWILNVTSTEPSGPAPYFIYISVIPDGFQSNESGVIYNYDRAATETLLNMQVGESKSVHPDPNIAPGFTFTRLPDTTINNQAAQTYENTQPWEFPQGTKEIRYYIRANDCTYLFGGYIDTVSSGQTGAINEELFNQIIATFQVNP